MIEYECIANQTNDIDLTNYILDNIEEGNNTNLLKKSNLNELVSKTKSTLGDLAKLENITQSLFTYDDLVDIVIFQMNEKIENISANDFKFNFIIEGKLDKDITQMIIEKEFELIDVDTKVNCIFTIGLNRSANLSCDFNAENNKDIKTFSFKTSQIKANSTEIYLSKFNDIILINTLIEKDTSDLTSNDTNNTINETDIEDNRDNKDIYDINSNFDNKGNNKNKNDNNKNFIITIIVSIVCGVIGIILIKVGIFFLIRKFCSSEQNQSNIDKKIIPFENNIIYEGTSQRIN